MQNINQWSRRDILVRSAGFAAVGLAAPLIASCTRTSTSSNSGTGLLEPLKAQGFVSVGVAGQMPYGYIDKRGRVTGEAPEVARAVFKRLGVAEVKAKQVGLEQLIPALNAGQFDVVCAGLYITPARCKNALFSHPDYGQLEKLLVPKGNPENIKTLTDVARGEVKLAIVTGSASQGYAKAAGVKAAQVSTFETMQDLLQAVTSGRVYAAELPDLQIRSLVRQNAGAPVEVTPGFQPVVSGKPVANAGGFVFRQGEQELVDAFNRELKAIHHSGEWLKIAEPFGFTEENLPPKDLTTEQICTAT